MKASIVIATYNRADDLERCLDSLLTQQGCEMEVIIVDDASQDRTVELVQTKYAAVARLEISPVNRGSIKNRNYGASLATGDILLLIDDDTEFMEPHTLAEVMREFSDERVGAVGIPYNQYGEMKHAKPGEGAYALSSYIGCASAVRRTTFEHLGGYEPFFRHGAEEDDFCARMLAAGWAVKVADVTTPMEHYESPMRDYQKWDYTGRRSSILFIWKNCPALYIIPNLLITTARGVRHAFRVRRFRGNLSGLVSGYAGILLSLVGKGCERHPLSKRIYKLILRLRKSPLPLDEVLAVAIQES